MEMVTRVLGDLYAAGEHRHLHRRREVGGSEDDRLEPRRRGTDLLDVDQPAGRLDLGLDPDVPVGQTGALLHLGEQQVERHHLGRRLDLGQHELVETLPRPADHRDDVLVRPLRVPGVDPDAQHPVVPRKVPDGVDHLGPGLGLLGRGDRVLEVEEGHVGRPPWAPWRGSGRSTPGSTGTSGAGVHGTGRTWPDATATLRRPAGTAGGECRPGLPAGTAAGNAGGAPRGRPAEPNVRITEIIGFHQPLATLGTTGSRCNQSEMVDPAAATG